MKKCKKCGALFDAQQCGACAVLTKAKARANNPQKFKERDAAYRAANKKKINEYDKKRYASNPEKMRANAKQYRAANKDRVKTYAAKRRVDEPDKVRSADARWRGSHREEKKIARAKWWSDNPELRRVYAHNRRARERANGGTLSVGLAKKLFKLQKGKCACCGMALGENYHLDHIVPIVQGGANEDWNVQLLRSTCNREKHAKHPIYFMQSRGFLL
jgi:5-methylcytosine-specific restriction endonuclease McrA